MNNGTKIEVKKLIARLVKDQAEHYYKKWRAMQDDYYVLLDEIMDLEEGEAVDNGL